MNKKLSILAIILLLCNALQAQDAAALLEKAITLFEKGGVEMNVNIRYADDSAFPPLTATLKMNRERFFLTDGSEYSVWYDGKTQWTCRQVDGDTENAEVYIAEPTDAELQSISPYLLMKNYASQYAATLVKGSKLPKGAVSDIRLKAFDAKADITEAHLFLDKDARLVSLLATMPGADTLTFEVKSFKNGLKHSDAVFTCDTKTLKKRGAEIIDMR